MSVVFWKELADHFSSRRFMILLILIVFSGLWAAYATGQAIRANTDTVPTQYVFLLLLTSSGETLFSLATFLGFFGPLVGITLGFDSISGEYARGTLSRVLSQPIYRDSLINGKFFAGLTTVAVLWGSILLLVIGLGITLLGFPPNAEELWRMIIFTVVGVFYVGFWLALAMLFSLLFQKTVTAALASMAVWLFLSLFVAVISRRRSPAWSFPTLRRRKRWPADPTSKISSAVFHPAPCSMKASASCLIQRHAFSAWRCKARPKASCRRRSRSTKV